MSPSRSSDTGAVSVPASVMRSASSGSRAASASRAPCAEPRARISIQWPSSMIATRSASSHQKSRSNPPRPRLVTQDAANATVMAIGISSIIPGLRVFSSCRPPLKVHHWDGQDQGEPEPVLEHGGTVPGVLSVAVDRVVVVVSAMLPVGVSGVICWRACHRRRMTRYGLRGLVAGVVHAAVVLVVVFYCCPPLGECSLTAAELSSGWGWTTCW
jgi:hypothetical protein